ncbi:MAG: zinc ribbon domain-containing protein [Lachnotalea sp.]
MAFFDKLGESISSKSKDVAKKAKELAEISSLNGKISSQEEIIRETYLDLGKEFYEKYKNDSENEFEAKCDIITASYVEIEEIKKEINKIKNFKICPSCSAELTADAVFCSKCGYKFEIEIIEEIKEEKNICPSCNEELDEDVKFCTKCGYKINE